MKKFSSKLIVIFVLISSISSCAFSPSKEKMQAETVDFELPQINETKDVLVYVVYPEKSNSSAKFNIFVDGKKKDFKVATLKPNQFTHFFIQAGNHEIFSKGKNWASVKISGVEGETIFVKQNVLGGLSASKNHLEIIDEIEAKYYIKNSKAKEEVKEEKEVVKEKKPKKKTDKKKTKKSKKKNKK